MPESIEGVAVGATTAMDYENAADSAESGTETGGKIGRIEQIATLFERYERMCDLGALLIEERKLMY